MLYERYSIFLDGELIADIGGIHLSSGEYVDLWDYVEKGDTANHRMDVFYLERGAGGSTCWMQFTVPDAKVKAAGDTGSLRVDKSVVDPLRDKGRLSAKYGSMSVSPMTAWRQWDVPYTPEMHRFFCSLLPFISC